MEKLAAEMSNNIAGMMSGIDRTKGILGEVIAKSPGFIAAPLRLARWQDIYYCFLYTGLQGSGLHTCY